MKGREMTSSEYKIRTVIILALLLTWAAFAAAKVYTFTVRDRQVLLKRSHPIAWRTAEIPARRGRILDRDGAVLAEDVFRCDLILDRHPEKNRRHHLQRRLDEAIPGAELPPETAQLPVVLRKDLSADEIEKCARIFRGIQGIRTEGRLERRYAGNPAVREQLGETALNDRKERVGISGLEQTYDLELSGQAGRMRVMLDRNGSWIYETLQVIRQPENGRDVRLNENLAELEEKGPETYGFENSLAGK